MVDGDVLERSGQSYRGYGPMLDLVASKLRRPLARPGAILRLPLVLRLAQTDPRPIVSVVAPSGYGKTTLLAQWAERNGQSFAWVSVDENDNDPKVLLSYIAEALNAVQPVGERVFDALAHPQDRRRACACTSCRPSARSHALRRTPSTAKPVFSATRQDAVLPMACSRSSR